MNHDTFEDQDDVQAHTTGRIAALLGERSAELFAEPPVVTVFVSAK